MSCPAPTNVALSYKSGPKRLVASWQHTGKDVIGFTVRLHRIYSDPYQDKIVKKILVAKNTRSIAFHGIHFAPDQVYRAVVWAECRDCDVSTSVASDPFIIPCCTFPEAPTIALCSYCDPNFTVEIPKTQLDELCKADSVDVHLVDTIAGEHDYNIPRSAWGTSNGNYVLTIDGWAAAPAGAYTFTARKANDCGNKSSYSAACQVVV